MNYSGKCYENRKLAKLSHVSPDNSYFDVLKNRHIRIYQSSWTAVKFLKQSTSRKIRRTDLEELYQRGAYKKLYSKYNII